MIDFLSTPVPGAITGFQLLVSAIVTFTWGILAIYDAIGKMRKYGHSLWGSFSHSLGHFLIASDSLVYFTLSVAILRESGPVPAWFFVMMSYAFFWTLVAFKDWARGKISEGYGSG